jgi:DNA polymerase-3 subunit delta'
VTSPLVHPRESFDWVGEAAHEVAFLEALDRGRLHHAWLVTGPAGVGKATFAYRAARRLLGARPVEGLGPLGADPTDPVSRHLIARAHPDLLVLQADAEDGKTRRGIPAEEARSISEFFSKSPAASAWRVAIVDTADDLNAQGANALLKTLEEPPARGVIFLLSNTPGGLLATLRSRCRRLAVHPPASDAALSWLEARAGIEAGEAARLLSMAGGAPGEAWRLANEGALEIDAAARDLIASLPSPDPARVQSLADSFRGAAGSIRFTIFFGLLAERIHDRALDGVRAGEREAPGRWAEAWSHLIEAPRRAEAVNLDRGEVFFDAVSRLSAL